MYFVTQNMVDKIKLIDLEVLCIMITKTFRFCMKQAKGGLTLNVSQWQEDNMFDFFRRKLFFF